MSDVGDRQLAVGNVLRHGASLFIVEDGLDADGTVTFGELGDRKVPAAVMFALGDPCPVPTCDGDVVEGESPRHRECSNGCLAWYRNYPVAGDDCKTASCDGEVIVESASDGRYTVTCTECGLYSFGSIRWREAWQAPAKRDALAAFQDDGAASTGAGAGGGEG